MLAFEDRRSYVYVAGDATRAYAPGKLETFTRQIVYLRPDTFVIFDRVKSKNPSFTKTWLLQAMEPPTGQAPAWVITNGAGRLFLQTVLPEQPRVHVAQGEDLYRYGGRAFPPRRDTGPAPKCRIEISPSEPAELDYFLHVLTAAAADTEAVPRATVRVEADTTILTVGETEIGFSQAEVGGYVARGGKRVAFTQQLPHGAP